MIEPAGYGAAVVFGPHVWNFRDTAERLVQAGGAIQVSDAAELEEVVGRLCADPSERRTPGPGCPRPRSAAAGRTERTLDALDQFLQLGAARAA